ncbi:hypothetical protein BJY21_001806 [Kineosphaera limosa]|uniref:Uncharacterized protein n=1 Tax=Kineosphaera limosa NBRC 100340 TaxID=1184609 RepID=K6XFA6_9MICO|nr:hypothetical protein [Kineosphaera limosa]NYE00622.1 hypothetical protein [Kineosphaera limosa]GAB97524.1 hypothetical protein KILIM_073_00040 [Kineosphaera limosa NBRC 100340]
MGNNWNKEYTDLIRSSLSSSWGNWSLSSDVAPGAVGIADPQNGNFHQVSQSLPGLTPEALRAGDASFDWNFMSSGVSRTETKIEGGGSGTDPQTGTKLGADLKMEWKFGHERELSSQCAVEKWVRIKETSTVTSQLDWLVGEARQAGMAGQHGIAQGFGVITRVLYARSGVNVASVSADNTFSIEGSASAVHSLVGEGRGAASFSRTSSTKSVDKHMWPSEAGIESTGLVPIAYDFASFDGRLLLPQWVTTVGAYTLLVDSKVGCTYTVKSKLTYSVDGRMVTRYGNVAPGRSVTYGDIPVAALDLNLRLEFVCVGRNEVKEFHWSNPRGQWINGHRTVVVSGVWPGRINAVEAG